MGPAMLKNYHYHGNSWHKVLPNQVEHNLLPWASWWPGQKEQHVHDSHGPKEATLFRPNRLLSGLTLWKNDSPVGFHKRMGTGPPMIPHNLATGLVDPLFRKSWDHKLKTTWWKQFRARQNGMGQLPTASHSICLRDKPQFFWKCLYDCRLFCTLQKKKGGRSNSFFTSLRLRGLSDGLWVWGVGCKGEEPHIPIPVCEHLTQHTASPCKRK